MGPDAKERGMKSTKEDQRAPADGGSVDAYNW